MRSISSVKNLSGKRVLLRVDFNVPTDKAGKKVLDDTRIREAMPTIKLLRRKGAQVFIIAHFKRPQGRVVEEMRLGVVAKRVGKMLGGAKREVRITNYGGFEGYEIAENIVLLENIRFYPEEESKDRRVRDGFAKRLAKLGDIYVDDAFGNAHRDHASMTGLPKYLPSYAGLLLFNEVKNLKRALTSLKKHPSVVIIGGAKISTKIGLIKSFLGKADHILLGGALANTILRANGVSVGKSLVEPEMVSEVKKLDYTTTHIELPVDGLLTTAMDGSRPARHDAIGDVRADEIIADIGPETVELYTSIICKAKVVIWNGPMGIFEVPQFAKSTTALAKSVASSKATSYIGGGETVEAIEKLHLEKKITWISTGGGAMLEFLEKGGKLPALEALE